jgi:hypothetical protein
MQTEDLRTIVEALDRAMARWYADGGTPADSPALRACWARLVERLALEKAAGANVRERSATPRKGRRGPPKLGRRGSIDACSMSYGRLPRTGLSIV